MICGAADEGSAALFVWGGGTGFAWRANRREFVDWCKVWR